MVRSHNKAAGISDMPVTSEHVLVFSARYLGTLDLLVLGANCKLENKSIANSKSKRKSAKE